MQIDTQTVSDCYVYTTDDCSGSSADCTGDSGKFIGLFHNVSFFVSGSKGGEGCVLM